MAAVSEIQTGKGYIYGIAAMTITPSGGGTAITGNAANVRWTDEWVDEEIPSQNGSIIEASIGSRRKRTLEFDFAPTSTTRALAKAEADQFMGCSPNQVITIAADDHAIINTTYNFKSGGTYTRTRDGIGLIGIKLCTYETTTADSFAALAIITG